MNIDSATLDDIEALSSTTQSGPTLWHLIDRTRTRAGRRMLHQRLVSLSHTVEEIEALQRAHQALATEAALYIRLLDRANCDAIEAYLASRWQLPATMSLSARLAGSLWSGRWYWKYLQNVTVGQCQVIDLLAAADELRQHLEASRCLALEQLAARLAALTDLPQLQELRRLARSRSTDGRRAFDQLARETAKSSLAAVIECVGTVEAMLSLAVATAEHGWVYPRPGPSLRIAGLVHPFLGPDSVANDLNLSDNVRVVFLTGPNMAGKSTFLKAVLVAMILAHAGAGVPARSMEFPVVEVMFSSVKVEDSLSAGESFYLAEVRRIRALAQALRTHSSAIAIIDEPFRGTNAHDAAEATLAVITRVAEHPRALVFVASHIAKVVPAIVDNPRMRLLHFAADMTAEQPRFDYRIRDGVSTQRLGMTLLKQEGVLELLDGFKASPGANRGVSPDVLPVVGVTRPVGDEIGEAPDCRDEFG